MKDHPLLRGSLETIILSLLAERDEMYGYEITKTVKESSNGQLNITEGALYPALHRLEARGMLTVRYVSVNNRKRKYYSITPLGGKHQKSKLAEFQDFVYSMKQILLPENGNAYNLSVN